MLGGIAGQRLVLNPGSVGQPRDGDPRASWALYDGDSILFRRVAYDVQATVESYVACRFSADAQLLRGPAAAWK